jgi:hypothetical protein
LKKQRYTELKMPDFCECEIAKQRGEANPKNGDGPGGMREQNSERQHECARELQPEDPAGRLLLNKPKKPKTITRYKQYIQA